MLETTSLGVAETAVARHHTYTLLSHLLLQGLTADLWPIVQQVPELHSTLPSAPNFEETAVAHQTLFTFDIFPYESIFRDSSGLLGGDITEAVIHSYQAAGFYVQDDATSPDHIGHEMALLAFLCGAEADAWEDALPLVARHMQTRQQEFLQQHVLTWFFPLALAVQQQGNAFYTAVFTLAADLIIDHAQQSGLPTETRFALPDTPALLSNDKTSLKDIAAYLTNPVYSGFALSRGDVARLARAHKLPRGFGKRDLMLHNLLQAAAQYEMLPALLQTLLTLVEEWQMGYGRFAAQSAMLTPFLQPWQERIAATKALLATMQQHAAAAQPIS
ncbi:MAG: molecular chaperone TorD family protein [Ardenticatenaceae bacterium]|nr:molecular chaperone TorD family protein [Ardenticatenaceae bacterium]